MRNKSLARSLAKSSLISLIAAIGLIAATSAISANEPVYKWKDANGQSHYSQQPPDGIKYETITPSGAPVTGAAAGDHATAPAKAAPATTAGAQTPAQAERQKQCDSAKSSIDTLSTRPVVQMDINNTGTPVTLTPEQQNHQLDVARKQAQFYCGGK